MHRHHCRCSVTWCVKRRPLLAPPLRGQTSLKCRRAVRWASSPLRTSLRSSCSRFEYLGAITYLQGNPSRSGAYVKGCCGSLVLVVYHSYLKWCWGSTKASVFPPCPHRRVSCLDISNIRARCAVGAFLQAARAPLQSVCAALRPHTHTHWLCKCVTCRGIDRFAKGMIHSSSFVLH